MPRASSTHGQPASLSTIRRQEVHTAHAWHGEPRLRVCGAGDEVSGDELYL